MTEYKNKFITFILFLLPFIYLFNNYIVIGRLNFGMIFKLIVAIYFIYYLIFKTNSKYKSYTGLIILLGILSFLYLSVNLNTMKFKYIDSYVEFITNFTLLPLTLISMLCIYNDTGFNKKTFNILIIYNLLIYSIFNILKLNFMTSNIRELTILVILLYPVLFNNIRPKLMSIVLSSIIIYGLSFMSDIYMIIGISILLLIGFITNIKRKEINTFILITLLFLIINFSFNKNIIFYKFSFLNFIILFPLLITFITVYIYNLKSKKTKLSKEVFLILVSCLIISYMLLFEKVLLYNYYLFFYISLMYCYIGNEINLFEKDKINKKKIVFLAPISSRFNSKNDSIDFAKLLDKSLNVEIVFKSEDNSFYKFPREATILYLSENRKTNIKNTLRKFVMYQDAGVLIALDNDTAKIINKYSRTDAKKIMIKQGDYTSIEYGKFLGKKLKNIPTIFFTSKRALNIYSSVLSTKKCYYIDSIGNHLKDTMEDKDAWYIK